jgi:hypothetical protein
MKNKVAAASVARGRGAAGNEKELPGRATVVRRVPSRSGQAPLRPTTDEDKVAAASVARGRREARNEKELPGRATVVRRVPSRSGQGPVRPTRDEEQDRGEPPLPVVLQ